MVCFLDSFWTILVSFLKLRKHFPQTSPPKASILVRFVGFLVITPIFMHLQFLLHGQDRSHVGNLARSFNDLDMVILETLYITLAVCLGSLSCCSPVSDSSHIFQVSSSIWMKFIFVMELCILTRFPVPLD